MGLKGLFSVIKDNQHLWMNISTIQRPAKLVIDGRTIANSIYSDCRFDGLCGGQYTEYFERIIRLFFRLKSFGFDIVILMECGKQENNDVDIYDRRMTRWIQFRKSLKEGEPYSRLPLLGYYIFIKAANILDLKILPTDIDTTISLLGIAKLSNAYVLTNRNDSFICDIPGVLTLNYISWQGDKLHGKFYAFSRFLKFTNLTPSFIPLLFLLSSPETYISNSYCVQEVNQTFNQLTSMPIHATGEKLYFRRRFDRALSYLQAHGHEYIFAYQQLRSRLEQRFHATMDDSLDLANTKIYNPEKLGSLDISKHNFGMDYSNTLGGHPDISSRLLFRVDYGFWGALGLNDQCVFVSTRAENFAEEAAGLISRHIRRIIYGIISKDESVIIKEHLRSKEPLSHTLDNVTPIKDYKGVTIPYIVSIDELSQQEKAKLLFHCLDFDPSLFLDLPKYWYLPVLSVHFWLSRRERRVSENACKLLILCFLACSNGEDLSAELSPMMISSPAVNDNIGTLQQIAEWQFVVFDIMALKSLLGLDSLLISPERLYNGHFYFSMIINDKFANRVKSFILVNEEVFHLYEKITEIALAPILSPSS